VATYYPKTIEYLFEAIGVEDVLLLHLLLWGERASEERLSPVRQTIETEC